MTCRIGMAGQLEALLGILGEVLDEQGTFIDQTFYHDGRSAALSFRTWSGEIEPFLDLPPEPDDVLVDMGPGGPAPLPAPGSCDRLALLGRNIVTLEAGPDLPDAGTYLRLSLTSQVSAVIHRTLGGTTWERDLKKEIDT